MPFCVGRQRTPQAVASGVFCYQALLEKVVKFVDVICRFGDAKAEFKEQDHPRDEDGQFATSEQAIEKREPNHTEESVHQETKEETVSSSKSYMTKEKRDGLALLKTNLERGAAPRVVIKEAAKLMCGTVSCELPNVGEVDVEVGKAFLKECEKYLYHPHSNKPYPRALQKKHVSNQLFAYEHIDEVLKNGENNGWKNDPKHHPNFDFLSVRKKIKVETGQEKWVTVDVKIRRMIKDNTVVTHNVSTTGNPGFDLKMRNWKKVKDSSSYVFDVYEVSVM